MNNFFAILGWILSILGAIVGAVLIFTIFIYFIWLLANPSQAKEKLKQFLHWGKQWLPSFSWKRKKSKGGNGISRTLIIIFGFILLLVGSGLYFLVKNVSIHDDFTRPWWQWMLFVLIILILISLIFVPWKKFEVRKSKWWWSIPLTILCIAGIVWLVINYWPEKVTILPEGLGKIEIKICPQIPAEQQRIEIIPGKEIELKVGSLYFFTKESGVSYKWQTANPEGTYTVHNVLKGTEWISIFKEGFPDFVQGKVPDDAGICNVFVNKDFVGTLTEK